MCREQANRFKDAKEPVRIVIVHDMWRSSFDAPCLHTMFDDKPMQSHDPTRAIACANRVVEKGSGISCDGASPVRLSVRMPKRARSIVGGMAYNAHNCTVGPFSDGNVHFTRRSV